MKNIARNARTPRPNARTVRYSGCLSVFSYYFGYEVVKDSNGITVYKVNLSVFSYYFKVWLDRVLRRNELL